MQILRLLLMTLGAIHLFVIFLVLIPRPYSRRLRRALAALPMALWVSTSRFFQIGHDIMWQRGNGNDGDPQ